MKMEQRPQTARKEGLARTVQGSTNDREGVLSPRGDNLQILGAHYRSAARGFVVFGPELLQIGRKRSLGIGIQPCERSLCRPKILAEELHHFARRKGIVKLEDLRGGLDGGSVRAQPLADSSLFAPQNWRLDFRRRWNVTVPQCKLLPDEPLRGPVGHRDDPASPADS